MRVWRVWPLPLLLIGLFVPAIQATHDPNDFFVSDWPLSATAIHGSSAGNWWAVSIGNPTTGSAALYHRIGPNSWATDSPQLGTINGVFSLSAVEAYACGEGPLGDFSRWDGVTWNPEPLPFTDICSPPGFGRQIWAFSDIDIYIASGDAGIGHWDGVAWSTVHTLAAGTQFNSLMGFSPSNLWAVWSTSSGVSGLSHWDGLTWTVSSGSLSTSAGQSGCRGLWGTSSSNLYAVCQQPGGPVIARTTDGGATYALLSSTTAFEPNSIWGSSATDIWIVGSFQSPGHSTDGVTFTAEPAMPSASKNAIWGTSSTDVYLTVSATGSESGIWKLQVNAPAGAPNPAIVDRHHSGALTVSQAQCNGDRTSFSINADATVSSSISSVTLTVLDSETGVPFGVVPLPFVLGFQVYHGGAVFPPGDYVAVAVVDFSGVGAVDIFDSHAFNVPVGTCTDTPTDLEPLAGLIRFEHNQTNSYVNSTHLHIDSHFNQTYTFLNQSFDAQETLIIFRTSQTNGYVNSSRVAIISAINNLDLSIDCGANGTDCEFEPMTMIDLPGMTDQQVGAFLLFLVVLIIAFFQRWLFVAIACVIGILDVVLIGGIFGFTFTGLLLVLGIVMQILVDHRDALREARAEKEAEQVG